MIELSNNAFDDSNFRSQWSGSIPDIEVHPRIYINEHPMKQLDRQDILVIDLTSLVLSHKP